MHLRVQSAESRRQIGQVHLLQRLELFWRALRVGSGADRAVAARRKDRNNIATAPHALMLYYGLARFDLEVRFSRDFGGCGLSVKGEGLATCLCRSSSSLGRRLPGHGSVNHRSVTSSSSG